MAWTWAAFLTLRDAERLAGYQDEARDIVAAGRMALAVNEPKQLAQEGRELEQRMRRDERRRAPDRGNERDRIAAFGRQLRRAERARGR